MYSRNDGNINKTDLLELCPAVLYQLSKKQCHAREKKVAEDEEDTSKEKPARGIPNARSKFYICINLDWLAFRCKNCINAQLGMSSVCLHVPIF